MDSGGDEVSFYFPNMIRIYKDGRVERLAGTEIVPAIDFDPQTGVSSKDIIIEPETGVSARLFLPKINPNSSAAQKLSLLIYIHGGGFCIGTPFCTPYNRHVSQLVAEANVVAVSVHYKRAPEHPLPIAYDDSWAAIQWVASHSKGNGPEAWLNEQADLSRVTVIGDSAGANISHNMALRAAETPLEGLRFVGLGLVHPYFHGEAQQLGLGASDEEKKAKADKLWMVMCPSSSGCDDPLMNPATCSNLEKLACKRVLVCVAGKDRVKERGVFYCETLGKSGWEGELELVGDEGEDHVFHLHNPTSEKAVAMLSRLATFLNQH